MKKPFTIDAPRFQELITFTFRVLLFWYIIAALLEAVLPGFVTLSIDLDLFLWAVILLGVLQFVTNTYSR